MANGDTAPKGVRELPELDAPPLDTVAVEAAALLRRLQCGVNEASLRLMFGLDEEAPLPPELTDVFHEAIGRATRFPGNGRKLAGTTNQGEAQ